MLRIRLVNVVFFFSILHFKRKVKLRCLFHTSKRFYSLIKLKTVDFQLKTVDFGFSFLEGN